MRLKYSPESILDLQRLHDFIAPKNPLSARKIAIEIQQSAEKLKQFPQIGLSVSRAEGLQEIRDLYVGNYTIRYLVASGEAIFILRIWHNKETEKDL